MLEHLLALREALARGETPAASGICDYVGSRCNVSPAQAFRRLKPHWQNWPELDPRFPPEWPVAGSMCENFASWREAGEAYPERRWTNPRRLSLLNHLIQEFSNEADL